jgi:hypothetical protein
LAKITDDVLGAIDSGKISFLIALDLSAAFDTLDHQTLLDRLNHTFGITNQSLAWISSYLVSRSSFVSIDGHHSSTLPCTTGVPQGSVLGPLLFILFVSPLSNVISNHTNLNEINFHQYADDTQLYLSATKTTVTSVLAKIESCTIAVHEWLSQNGLVLNSTKSDAIIFANPRSKPSSLLAASCTSITVAGAHIPVSQNIKSLGVYLDSKLSFDKHISEITKSCYFHIKALRHIRPSLTPEASNTIACSIVGSRLDYCNSLLVCTSIL